jgi:hypothetical protein
MAARSPAAAVLRECNAVYALSLLACSVGPCASRTVDVVPGNPATKNWPQTCQNGDARKWRHMRWPNLWKQARSRGRTSFRFKRWEIRHDSFQSELRLAICQRKDIIMNPVVLFFSSFFWTLLSYVCRAAELNRYPKLNQIMVMSYRHDWFELND